MSIQLNAQNDSTFTATDSAELALLDSIAALTDTVVFKDTLTPGKFIPYDKGIFHNSKINLRKTLTASRNPPKRKNLDNWLVLLWAIIILLLIIFFKSNFALQYRLLNKAWFSTISFNEFFSTQTTIFKNSKLLTWLIITQCISIGIFIVIKSVYSQSGENEFIIIRYGESQYILKDYLLCGMISGGVGMLFIANQWLRNVFSFSFYQPSLGKDYAIIFRIQAYVVSLFLLPILLYQYYNGAWDIKIAVILTMIIFMLTVYASTLVKFVFSGQFLQNQSNFILILYLCAFEILPLLVVIKSINNLLKYD